MRFQAGLSNLILLSALGLSPVAECTIDTALKAIQTVGEVAAAAKAIKNIWEREVTAEGDFSLGAELEPFDALDARATTCLKVPAGVPSNVVTNCCSALSGKTIYISGWRSAKSKSVLCRVEDCLLTCGL